MKSLAMRVFSIFVTSAIGFVACGGDGNGEAGSTGDPPGTTLDVTPSLSECRSNTGAKIPDSPMPYCDAELLLWNYDASTRTLGLLNSRIQLNCCGNHAIAVRLEDGVYVVTETDAPETLPDGTTARCGCECVFDYGADVSPVEAGTISMKIVREVPDQTPASSVAWEGTIDLSAGSGNVVISTETAEPWCSGAVP